MNQSDMSITRQRPWALNTALLPTIGVALIPKLTCPACWPAYAGLFSTMGIGFFNYTPWIMPLTLIFVLITLVALFWRARKRRGYRPLLLGITASAVLLIGKFVYENDMAMYAGLVFLIAASIWNTWPLSGNDKTQQCPACDT